MTKTAAVCGAGGFIGGHLVAALRAQQVEVRALDIKPLHDWYQVFTDVDNIPNCDLARSENCGMATEGVSAVYNLAASMGGMGFIEANRALCMLNVLINTHLLMAARLYGVERFFFASSACVYAQVHQRDCFSAPLTEADAYPADPEAGYGEEKLFSERLCQYYAEDFGLETRVARFHNVYGPHGTWDGGREKAPAALCRKVAQAVLGGEHTIEIWGDGTQTRSFMWIADCIQGIQAIMDGPYREPVNVGSADAISINQLADLVAHVAGVTIKRTYRRDAPKGVNSRNSDNTLFKARYGWEPSTPLVTGLAATYEWIYKQLTQ